MVAPDSSSGVPRPAKSARSTGPGGGDLLKLKDYFLRYLCGGGVIAQPFFGND